MNLKQRLAELLPHFDDAGYLLPNKVLMENPAGCWRLSNNTTFAYVMCEMVNGVSFRIEKPPKRPREVTVRFDKWGVPEFVMPDNPGAVRLIEDTPREVTDADVEYCWGYYMQMHEESAKQAFKRMLQHYEQLRSK